MVEIDAKKDYYQILGVAIDASPETIRGAYRQLVRRLHPDTANGDADKFRLVQEAYEILRDKVYRRAYDRQRASRGVVSSEGAAAPTGGTANLGLLQSRKELPLIDSSQVLYVLLTVVPKVSAQHQKRQHLNLALVVDRSTSMQGARMHNVKVAAADLVDSLGEQDRLSLVTFSDRAQVVAPAEMLTNKHAFRSAINSIQPAGGTEIYQGLFAGLKEIRRYQAPDTLDHVIFLTDGRTYGDEEKTLTLARRAAREGIGISAFGIGEDWNDTFLDSMVQYGGGVSQYINSPSQVRKVLRAQVRELSNLVLQKLTLHVNTADYVHLENAFRSTPYMEELRANGNNVVAVGGLGSGEPVAIVLELIVERSQSGERRIARFELSGEDVADGERVNLRQDLYVTFTQNPGEQQAPSQLLHALQRLSVYRLQEEAWKALEGGNVHQATRYLEAAATHLFDLGYRELGQAAMLEVGRMAQGGDPTGEGRKKLRYGTRVLSLPTS